MNDVALLAQTISEHFLIKKSSFPKTLLHRFVMRAGGAQQCTTTIMNDESNTAVLEFDYVSNDCLIDYKGNLVPKMLWYGPEPFDQQQVTTTPQVWNGMQIIQVLD